jgi:hypothetical protein
MRMKRFVETVAALGILAAAAGTAAASALWQPLQIVSTTTVYSALHSADFDGDGRDELLAGSRGAGIRIWSFDTSTQSWYKIAEIPVGGDVHDIASGDLDKDGDIDVVYTLRGYGCYVAINNGGSWTLTPLQSIYGNTVEILDMDLDGNLDVLHNPGGWESGYATVFYGDGHGGFPASSGPSSPIQSAGSQLIPSDLNHDGLPDLVGTSYEYISGNPHVHLRAYLNQGDRTWSSSLVMSNIGFAAEGGADGVGDLNNDGYADLAARDWPATDFAIFWGGEDGSANLIWTRQVIASYANPPGWVSLTDVDGDGRPDVTLAGQSAFPGVQVRYGDGLGGLSAPEVLAASVGQIWKMDAQGDFNGDGRRDIVVSKSDGPLLGVVFGMYPDPVADAGPDRTMEATGPLTDIVLDGSASYNPDPNNPIQSYRWYAEDGRLAAEGVQPTLSLRVGAHTFTLIVNDGQRDSKVTNDGSADDSVVAVVVQDTTKPRITVALTPDHLWPPNHRMRMVHARVAANDAADPSPKVVLTSIVSNEPEGHGDGHRHELDIWGADFGTEDYDFALRAEKNRHSPFVRTYAITYTATDASGNFVSGSDVVVVKHCHHCRCHRHHRRQEADGG